MTWVADEARIEALVYRDGPEVWRNLKLNIKEAVAEYTNIYSPGEIREVQYTDCAPVNANCIRVRALPPTEGGDVSHEIFFDPDKRTITCPTLSLTFTLEVQNGEIVTRDSEKQLITVEEMCKAFLKPIFKTLPRRRPKILLTPVVS